MENKDDGIKFDVVDNDMNELYGQSKVTTPSAIHTTVPKDGLTLEEKIKQYVAAHNPLLYVLTPCYGGTCFVNYTQCIMKTVELFKRFNIELKVEFCKNDSLVTRARNN